MNIPAVYFQGGDNLIARLIENLKIADTRTDGTCHIVTCVESHSGA